MVAVKPTMRHTKMKEMKERSVKKKALGRSGMQRTAAGSELQGYTRFTVRETARESSQDSRTSTEILPTERGYLPIGSTEAKILSTLAAKLDISPTILIINLWENRKSASLH